MKWSSLTEVSFATCLDTSALLSHPFYCDWYIGPLLSVALSQGLFSYLYSLMLLGERSIPSQTSIACDKA